MDLAVGAKRLVMMEHLTQGGRSRSSSTRCTYPLTALRCVARVYTDLAVLDVTPRGLVVRERVEGLSHDALVALIGRAVAHCNRPEPGRAAADTTGTEGRRRGALCHDRTLC